MKVDELKNRLRKALDANNKKPIDLTNDLGIPKSSVSQYLSGLSKNMPTDRLYKISQYLGVSETWLLGYDDDSSIPESKRTRIDKINNLIAQLTEDELDEAMKIIEYTIYKRKG